MIMMVKFDNDRTINIIFHLDYHDPVVKRYSFDCNEEKGTIIHLIVNINEIQR